MSGNTAQVSLGFATRRGNTTLTIYSLRKLRATAILKEVELLSRPMFMLNE
jgi:hypothetical protein